MHWTDAASAHLLGRIAEATRTNPWLLISVRREEDGGFDTELGDRVTVGPLSDERRPPAHHRGDRSRSAPATRDRSRRVAGGGQPAVRRRADRRRAGARLTRCRAGVAPGHVGRPGRRARSAVAARAVVRVGARTKLSTHRGRRTPPAGGPRTRLGDRRPARSVHRGRWAAPLSVQERPGLRRRLRQPRLPVTRPSPPRGGNGLRKAEQRRRTRCRHAVVALLERRRSRTHVSLRPARG